MAHNPKTDQIDLEIVENCLLPTKAFYEEYVDSIRVYLNETNTPQVKIREAVGLEVPDILRSYGINTNDKTFTIPQARNEVYKQHKIARQGQEFINRSMQMASDAKLRERYFEKVEQELIKLEKNPNKFVKLVNSNIN